MAALARTIAALEGVLDRAGYPAVRTPMFERFNLLAMRAGDAIRHSMFTFTSERVEYALRPEMTTPVGRMVASGELGGPPPRRVRYAAPCFRYERPGSRRQREFTQVGAELFDAPAPWGDVEMIALASECADAVDGDRIRLRIGNIGVFGSLLADLDSEARAVAGNLLNDALTVEARCAGLETTEAVDDGLSGWLRDLGASVFRLQQRVGPPESGALELPPEYTPDAVQRLAKELPEASRDATRRGLVSLAGLPEETAEKLVEGTQVGGAVDDVVTRGRELLGDAAAPALESLQEVCSLAAEVGVTGLEASLGVARGLEFYTGTVLAIVVPDAPGVPVLGGGGRYDNLIEDLGGPATPACGFALEAEQIVAVVGEKECRPQLTRLMILPESPDARVRAVTLSAALRRAGLAACVPQEVAPDAGAVGSIGVPAQGSFTLMRGAETCEAPDVETLVNLLRPVQDEETCQ
jgi:histidyl-tRNA synthetase